VLLCAIVLVGGLRLGAKFLCAGLLGLKMAGTARFEIYMLLSDKYFGIYGWRL